MARRVVPTDKEKDGSEDGDDSEYGNDSENGEEFEDEELQEDLPSNEENQAPDIEYDLDHPPMAVGSTYTSMKVFKLALSQQAIKHQFEYNIAKSAPKRFRAYCSRKALDKCPWWIYASTTKDGCTMKVKKILVIMITLVQEEKKKVKNATKHWICEKMKDFLIDDATLGAKELQKKLKEHHKVHIHYKRVYMSKELALRELYGDWDSSFDNLYRFKAEVERCCPGSFVIIDHHTINGKIRFRRFFFALKPCIEGFLSGCRPCLAIDSTFLTASIRGSWLVLRLLMGIIGCILLLLEFLIQKLMITGYGS